MARAFPLTATSVDFLEHVENIFLWPALPSVIVRILGDALPSFNEVPIVAIAVEHDALPFRQWAEVVLGDLLGDDEVVGTSLSNPPRFKLNEPAE